jgi:hypothetical protein
MQGRLNVCRFLPLTAYIMGDVGILAKIVSLKNMVSPTPIVAHRNDRHWIQASL